MSIRSVTVVAHHISFIEDARDTVTADMQQMVLAGLTNLVWFYPLPAHSPS